MKVTNKPDSTYSTLRRYSIGSIVGILVMVAGMAVTAGLIPVSGAVVATGHLAVSEDVSAIAHADGGVVAQINVHDGDRVRAGDSLFQLDSSSAQREMATLQSLVDMSRMTLARLDALEEGQLTITVPDELIPRLASPEVASLVDMQTKLLASLQASTHAAVGQIYSQEDQLHIQIESAEQARVVLIEGISSLDSQSQALRSAPLTVLTNSQLSALSQKATDARSELSELETRIEGMRSALTERGRQIEQLSAAAASQVLSEREAEQKTLASLAAELDAATFKLGGLSVLSPVDGVVAESKLRTIGGVIVGGETVMEVVPTGEGLVVKAEIGDADVDKARQGGVVRVLLSGLPPTTPQLQGKIITIAPDAVVDQESGARTYSLRASLPQSELDGLDSDIHLVAGMPVEIFIVSEDRSIASYLVEPLLTRLVHAFREN